MKVINQNKNPHLRSSDNLMTVTKPCICSGRLPTPEIHGPYDLTIVASTTAFTEQEMSQNHRRGKYSK